MMSETTLDAPLMLQSTGRDGEVPYPISLRVASLGALARFHCQSQSIQVIGNPLHKIGVC